jgi:diguanylate cyclase (GGDEF)-like protein
MQTTMTSAPSADPSTTIWWRRPMVSVYAIIIAVAVLAYRTGGQSSPYLGLIYVPLVLAGLLSMRQSLKAASVGSLAYAAVTALRPAPRPWLGVFQVGLFFAVAVLTADGMRRHETRRRRQEMDAEDARQALDIQHLISSAYDLSVTMDLVALKQRETVMADSYAVLLTDNEMLNVCLTSGLPAAAMSLRLLPDAEENGWRPSDGYPLLVRDTEQMPTRYSALDPDARSILAVPLHSVERLVGLLFFGSRKPDAFSQEDFDRAESFGNHIVFPIQRAQLEEDLRRLAFTDAQTALFNHRHFQGQLEEEVSRAQRYSRPVSVILMDIDDFKALNDRYGHPAGDRLLRDLSHRLKESLRTVDIAARYGGEEFVVICPETQRDQAVALAERLRATIAAADFDSGGPIPHKITVSVGVASFPLDADTKGALVDAADQALYEAKRSGKDRVVAYSAIAE